jgi:hypothetical protein
MGRPRLHESEADKVRAFRERTGVTTLTFEIPKDLLVRFNDYLLFKDVKKSAVLVKLIESQLLRKR